MKTTPSLLTTALGLSLALAPAVFNTAALADQAARITQIGGKQPLSFEPNQGQADGRVNFISRGSGSTIFLTSAEAAFVIHNAGAQTTGSEAHSGNNIPHSQLLRMQLVGGQTHAKALACEPLPGKVNYFIGRDAEKWHTNIPTYGKVRYENVYDGIDLVYYGNERQLEFDFIVAPGADPDNIALQFAEAEKLAVDAQGDLKVTTRSGLQVVQHKPLIYQTLNGERREVKGGYILRGNEGVGLQIAQYDHGQALVIDPTLSYSTYLGGSGYDVGRGVAVDAAGNVYIAGETASSDFPTTQGALQSNYEPQNPGAPVVFVTKFTPGGVPVYSTYLGSAHGGEGFAGGGIAVDASGYAYVTGITGDPYFPTTSGAFRQSFSGNHDAFIFKLSPDGSALVYSTYLGGSDFDAGLGIALDNFGNACIIGLTTSTDLPTSNAFRPAYAGPANAGGNGFGDYFVSKINATGSALIFSTYLGGTDGEGYFGDGYDAAYSGAIAVDAEGGVYVTGATMSSDFPTTPNALQPTRSAKGADCGATCPSAFVSKFSSAGALIYSSYLGGSGFDAGIAIAADSAGDAYVAGRSGSCDFPFQKQAVSGDNNGAFVAKFNADGSRLLYCTFLGGNGGARGIAVDSAGDTYVTGRAFGSFSQFCPIQQGFGGAGDAFAAELAPDGGSFIYSTFLGGTGPETGQVIAIDSAGNAYVVGTTSSTDFPTLNAFQPGFGGGGFDAFVVKIAASPTCSPGPTFGAFTSWPPCSLSPPTITCPPDILKPTDPGQCSAVVNYTVTAIANFGTATVTCSPVSGSAFPKGTTTVNCTAVDSVGNHSSCSFTVTLTNPAPVVTITGPASGAVYPVGAPVSFTGTFTDNAGDTHTAQWLFDGSPVAATVNEANGQASLTRTFSSAGVYMVKLIVTDSCGNAATANTVSGLPAMVVIYDPNGGFVTGGGWINSPAGAYVAQPTLTGKASFGFVSNYQKGATVPTGETEFQFQVANFNFHSTSYEWLVISGVRAQYKGSGTVNGAGNYGFILTAIDGQVSGGQVDKFRIKIWDKSNNDAIVYDNQLGASDSGDPTTAIAGGSIVIHK